MTDKMNTRGIVLMVLAMGAFALADTLVKMSASFLSPAQVLFYLMGSGLLLFAFVALVQGEKLLDQRAFAPVLLLRYVAEIVGMVGMVLALSYVPLSTVGAITQATPILVTVGAVLFLKEKVSWRRWSAASLGFIGVLLIVQPGAEGFDSAVLWAILAMASMSVRDLITRLTPPDMASASLATFTMIAAVPVAAGWVLYNGESFVPAETNWTIVLPMMGLGSLGYLLLIASIRMAEVSVVMPFRYLRIIFLLALGMVIFGERPSATMLVGAALIVLSGIYIMWREQKAKQTIG